MQPTTEQLRKWFETGHDALAAQVAPETIDAEQRTVSAVWFTGIDVPRYDWYRDETYLRRFDPAGADLSLLNNGAPILDNHWMMGAGDQKGKVEKAWVEGSNYLGTLRFSKRPEVEGLWQDIQDKIVTKFSMGVEILESVDLARKEGEPLVKLATKWRPYEISVAPIPADFGTTTLSAAGAAGERLRATAQSEREVPAMETNANTGGEARMEVNPEALRAEGARMERERLAGIDRTCAVFLKRGEIDGAFVETLKNEGKTVEQAKIAIAEHLAERSEETPTQSQHQAGFVTTDSRDKRREAMSAVLLHRMNPAKNKLDAGNEFRGLTLMEMAKECLDRAGVRYRGKGPLEIATLALDVNGAHTLLGSEGVERLGAMSTSDFPYILANTANKFLMASYAEQPSQWRQVGYQRNARDFKTQYPTMVSAAEELDLVPIDSGAYNYGKLSESRESYAVKTYGKIYSFTRGMIINDDLGAFGDIAAAQGRAVARKEASLFWALVTSNPNMADGTAVFAAGHSNLIDPGTAISIDNLGIARKTMRLQTGMAGEYIDITPRFLVVPPSKEQLALQYTSQNYVAAEADKQNIWAGTLQPIVERRLEASSTTAWYMVGSPAEAPGIIYAYLEGQEGVYQESRVGFNPDGMEFKARLDYGCGWGDHRGWVKNLGA